MHYFGTFCARGGSTIMFWVFSIYAAFCSWFWVVVGFGCFLRASCWVCSVSNDFDDYCLLHAFPWFHFAPFLLMLLDWCSFGCFYTLFANLMFLACFASRSMFFARLRLWRASAVLFLSICLRVSMLFGRRRPGVLFLNISLGVSRFPETFQKLWKSPKKP